MNKAFVSKYHLVRREKKQVDLFAIFINEIRSEIFFHSKTKIPADVSNRIVNLSLFVGPYFPAGKRKIKTFIVKFGKL